MARIVGAIATSHTPTIGFAFDRKLGADPTWSPIFAAYKPIREWLRAQRPDVLLVIYNDHATSFFFDHYTAFTLGVDDSYAPADEGGGPRNVRSIAGHAPLARGLGSHLMAQDFDMGFFRNRALDHGVFSPLSMLADEEQGWPWKIVPLQVGVLQFPLPSARRCFHLGEALRRAIASYPEDLRIVIVGTGGLSHQVHGERCGFNNPEWDHEFLDRLETDPRSLTELTHADLASRGGLESVEVIMWLIMRGALAPNVRCMHKSYYLPSMTAIATAIYEDIDPHQPSTPFIDDQLKNLDALAGTYPFTLERSAKAYRLNAFLHDLVHPVHRAHFLSDSDASMAQADLSAVERDMIKCRDWRAMIQYGAIFFVLEKLAAVSGVSNLHVYAAMRGVSVDEFQKTRNAKIFYNVSG